MKSKLIPEKVKVKDIVRESDDIFTITVNKKNKYMPGQFAQLSVLGYGECPISIASCSKGQLKFTIRETGRVTNALCNLKKGDTLYVRGPYGKGYPVKECEGKNLIIIGAGCGVATLRSAIRYVEKNREKYKEVFLFFGYRYLSDIVYKKDTNSWKKKFNIKIALSREKSKTCMDWNSGYITDVLKKLKLKPEDTGVFICGPPRMINDTVKILKSKKFRDDQIYMAKERLMYCATGVCCHCMIKGKFTCMDGPVFRFDEVRHCKND